MSSPYKAPDGWKPYQQRMERGPWSAARLVLGVLLVLMLGATILSVAARCFRQASTAAAVADEQFNARALLQKYEWFKDARAALDAKRANIATYEARLTRLEHNYGADRMRWPRDVREQAAIWEDEFAGIVASYNNLAAEYNAQMSKFNYRFANVGMLPAGATEAMPREYAPYNTGERTP